MSQRTPTPKEVNDYAQEYLVNGGDQVKAWRVAFPKSKAKAETQHTQASLFHDLQKVCKRILELKEDMALQADERFGISIESLLIELEEARKKGIELGQIGPTVSATMGKAKLTGYDVQVIEISTSEKLTPWDKVKAD